MSTLTLLPPLRVADGVQPDEDWRLSIAFYLEDGVTPIPLTGLAFTLNVGAIATLGAAGDHITVSGPLNNVLLVTVLAAEKASWQPGVYPLSLSASDGQYTRELFASSTLTVGSSQVAQVSLLVAPDASQSSIAAPLPAALAAAFQALQPDALAAALAALSGSQLSPLAQSLLAALPAQIAASEPVAAGQAFINSSGFVVIAQ
jgi:hypothetical protein